MFEIHVGDEVEFREHGSKGSRIQITGTVVRVQQGRDLTVGFIGEPYPGIGWQVRGHADFSGTKFTHGWHVCWSTVVAVRRGGHVSASHTGPVNCRQCNTVNEYAVANQPDGSYLCYNCR